MRYHNISKDDMLNGDGIRVVLWVSGCEHKCKGCQNPLTWDVKDGYTMSVREVYEIAKELEKDYVSGLTFSGGDPLHPKNRKMILVLAKFYKNAFRHKTIWLYTGYTWEEIMGDEIMAEVMKYIDVVVDGRFDVSLKDTNYKWAGSTNQRVIDVQKTLKEGKVVLHASN